MKNNQIKDLTEDQIQKLGWKVVKKYNHNQYNTNRYKLGCMGIEFTYEGTKLVDCDLHIEELSYMPISLKQATLLTEILVHWAE